MKKDLSGMTAAERAAYYEANADKFNDIFDGEPTQFYFDPDRTLTKVDGVLMSLREARTYQAKMDHAQRELISA